ncbi:hypothetical protein H0H81_009969 [Sphagnurus paluster]|uniref:Uncharacterized protein n=1 Tax=Sphagnurus paluster TaxID=117069 RepID=A0A9P7GJC6_9AGAR|nr:hypothetical protein H0H81_009969 [Sphagnurus paluster]
MLAVTLLTLLPLLAQAIPTQQSGANDGMMLHRREDPPTDQDLLLSCPGAAGSPNIRRADQCTLINIVDNPDEIVWKNLGNAQQNCGGSTTSTEVTLGGSTSFSSTTTVNANFGFSFEGLSIGGGASTSETKTESSTQSVKYSIPPGSQAVYTAGYNHKSQTGNVQVNFGKRVAEHYIVRTPGLLQSQRR